MISIFMALKPPIRQTLLEIINLAIYFDSFDFYEFPFLDKRTSENVSLSNFIRTSKGFGSFVKGSQGCLSKVKVLFT